MEQERFYRINSNDVLQSVQAFCNYYHLIRKYIDAGAIKSSLDRGAFARPQQVLNRSQYALLGAQRNSHSYAYGPEAGDHLLREKICVAENLKYGTKYNLHNIAIVAGAWSGVELVIEELANLSGGKTNKTKIAVLGPTHYQLFHRAINMLGVEIVGFNFTKPGQGSMPKDDSELMAIINENPTAIFITNPNNPNAEYFPPQLLKKLITLCTQRKIYIIID